ncbi:MAG: O-methyltransferase, partial [Trichococcus flocculiformis]
MALNEMMDRPVVKKELVAFMRDRLKRFPGELG